jgi:hypothetical protein
MRPYFFRLTTAVLLIFGLSCSSKSFNSDFDNEYDFSTFKRYRWANGDEMNPMDRLATAPHAYKRIRESADRILAKQGCTLVEGDDVDFVILAHAGLSERTMVRSTGTWWYSPWWGGGRQIEHFDEGTLVLDIVHWQNKELAWRGMGTKVFDDFSDNARKLVELDELVQQIMADYPPGKF